MSPFSFLSPSVDSQINLSTFASDCTCRYGGRRYSDKRNRWLRYTETVSPEFSHYFSLFLINLSFIFTAILYYYYLYHTISFTRARPDGKTICVPEHNVQIPLQPGDHNSNSSRSVLTVGAIVSFSFELQARRDTPINPIIFRLRSDLEWEDVIASTLTERKFVNGKF